MDSEFPFLVGRVAVTEEWSIDLPFAVMQRFEETQMVLWRPGFTVFLSAWNNDKNEPASKRKADFAELTSAGKYDESTTQDGGRLYYSYRIDEQSDDDRAPAFQGFAFGDQGHLQLSVYFDQEHDAELATRLLQSISDLPPTLNDVSLLSKVCFATNMVMEDGAPIGYMFREAPDAPNDSGWRFFSGQESQDYMDDPANTRIYPVALVAQVDPAVIPYLLSDYGHYGRDGNEFIPE